MSAFELLLMIYAGVLAAAALAVVYRMIVGPTILDRAISSDSLVTLVVMGMALYAAQSREAWAGPAMLALTGLAFIGTVTFARFVAREDLRQGRQRRHLDEPTTDTGPHEAIHPDPLGGGVATDEPANRFSEEAVPDPWGPEVTPAEAGAEPGSGTGSSPQERPGDQGTTGDRADHDDAEDDFATGFGAEPGSRGFEDAPEPRTPGTPTEGGR